MVDCITAVVEVGDWLHFCGEAGSLSDFQTKNVHLLLQLPDMIQVVTKVHFVKLLGLPLLKTDLADLFKELLV